MVRPTDFPVRNAESKGGGFLYNKDLCTCGKQRETAENRILIGYRLYENISAVG